MNIDLNIILLLGAIISVIGIWTMLVRKNLVIMLMGLELGVLGALLGLVGAARAHTTPEGQMGVGIFLVFWVLGVAASEVALGLALVLKLHASHKSVWVDEVTKDE